jgi:CRISPR-associated protein Cas1
MAEGVKLDAVRPEELAQCVVMGNVSLTTPAVQALLRAGTDVVFLTRSGRFLGRLSNGLACHVELRRAQFRAFEDPQRALDLARRFVTGKIENQRRLLRRHQKRKPSDNVAVALGRLRRSLAAVEGAGDLDALRGVEGAAAAAYFGCLGALITAPGIVFERRLRRPPPDPVNVLLSFGYTLLGNLVHAAVETAGLDPYLGCLHAPRQGRPSLMLDLVEEFRPVMVDSAMLRAVNTRAVKPSDFVCLSDEGDEVERQWERDAFEVADDPDAEPPERPILFTRLGVKKWLSVWERRLNDRVYYHPRGLRLPLREVIRAQVYLLARHLEGEGAYDSFLMPQ